MQTEKSAKTQSKLNKITEERDNELQFEHFRAHSPPKSQVQCSSLVRFISSLHFRPTNSPLN